MANTATSEDGNMQAFERNDARHAASETNELEGLDPVELSKLERVPGDIPWRIYAIGFIEMAERFSYFGTTVLFTNFIQQPLPPNSSTGAGGSGGQSGALGLGQRASTSISTFNVFLSYTSPLLGAILSDLYWGRYKTISRSIGVTLLGQILLVTSSLPTLLAVYPSNMSSLVLFLIALLIMGIGSGGFKSCISPLIAEQLPARRRYLVERSGKCVLVDSALTLERLYMYLFLVVNFGSLTGRSIMTYTEQYYGYYLAFAIPTLIFFLCPLLLVLTKKHYTWMRPSKSVLYEVYCLLSSGVKLHGGLLSRKLYASISDGSFWEQSKPSSVLLNRESRPEWMTFTDEWVDEVRKAFRACAVFAYFPIYWLTYNQINNNLTSQAATMLTHGIPNDLLSNIDPLTLIIFIPIFDMLIFPTLRNVGLKITPTRRIALGFAFGTFAMIWAGVLQTRIYATSPCESMANTCVDEDGKRLLSSIDVMWQVGSYMFIAISEILAAIAGLEFAFSQAPSNMRSLVMSLFLLTNAAGSVLGQIFVSDPYLVWNYFVAAAMSAIAGTAFALQFWNLNIEHEHGLSTEYPAPSNHNAAEEDRPLLVNSNADRSYQTFEE